MLAPTLQQLCARGLLMQQNPSYCALGHFLPRTKHENIGA